MIAEFILGFKTHFTGTHRFPLSHNNLATVKCQEAWATDLIADVTDEVLVGGGS